MSIEGQYASGYLYTFDNLLDTCSTWAYYVQLITLGNSSQFQIFKMCFQLLNTGICLWRFSICLVRCWCKEHLWEKWQEWRGCVIKDAWGKMRLYRDNCWELSHRLHLYISQDSGEVWAHSTVEEESRSEVESVVYRINKCLQLFALSNNDLHSCDTFCGSSVIRWVLWVVWVSEAEKQHALHWYHIQRSCSLLFFTWGIHLNNEITLLRSSSMSSFSNVFTSLTYHWFYTKNYRIKCGKQVYPDKSNTKILMLLESEIW